MVRAYQGCNVGLKLLPKATKAWQEIGREIMQAGAKRVKGDESSAKRLKTEDGAPAPRIVRAWMGWQGFWPNCSHHLSYCANNSGALGVIAQHANVLDGVFLGCEVGLRENGSVYMPSGDGSATQCAEVVAALRAVRRPTGGRGLTVHGVVPVIDCAHTVRINKSPEIFVSSAARFAEQFGFDGLNLE